MSSFFANQPHRASKNGGDDEMSESETQGETMACQKFDLAFRPNPNAFTSELPTSSTLSTSKTQTENESTPQSTISAADQVAFGRSLEDYYHMFEDWEEKCHKITKRYEEEFRSYSREYIGYCDGMGWLMDSEASMPYFPEVPVLPLKPVMPSPPSRKLEALVETAKTSKHRMVMKIHHGGHSWRVSVIRGKVNAVSGKKSSKRGISKIVAPAKPAKSRADAVERALGSLDVNSTTRVESVVNSKGALELDSLFTFANLSMRPKSKNDG